MIYHGRLILAFVFLLSIGPAILNAQGIVTDRPGFTAAAVVVPRHLFQLEAGAALETSSQFNDANMDHFNIGEALIRYGLFERLEARVELPDYNNVSFSGGSDQPSINGFGDSGLGVKYQIGPIGKSSGFDIAAIGMISIPTGSDEFSSNKLEPEVVLAANKVLGDALSVAGQISAGLPASDDGRALEWGVTFASATTVGKVGIFFEFSIDLPDQGDAPMMVHSGFVLPVGDRFQVDLHVALGVSDTAPDTIIGGGFSAGM